MYRVSDVAGDLTLRPGGGRICMVTGITHVMVQPGKDMNPGHGPDITTETGSGRSSLAGYGFRVMTGIQAVLCGDMAAIPLDGCLHHHPVTAMAVDT